jgi:hypothetical protein
MPPPPAAAGLSPDALSSLQQAQVWSSQLLLFSLYRQSLLAPFAYPLSRAISSMLPNPKTPNGALERQMSHLSCVNSRKNFRNGLKCRAKMFSIPTRVWIGVPFHCIPHKCYPCL